jgi:hypothetical protein
MYPYPVGSPRLVLYLDYNRLLLTFLRHGVKKEGLLYTSKEQEIHVTVGGDVWGIDLNTAPSHSGHREERGGSITKYPQSTMEPRVLGKHKQYTTSLYELPRLLKSDSLIKCLCVDCVL